MNRVGQICAYRGVFLNEARFAVHTELILQHISPQPAPLKLAADFVVVSENEGNNPQIVQMMGESHKQKTINENRHILEHPGSHERLFSST